MFHLENFLVIISMFIREVRYKTNISYHFHVINT